MGERPMNTYEKWTLSLFAIVVAAMVATVAQLLIGARYDHEHTCEPPPVCRRFEHAATQEGE